jgi:hypothetical protein
MTFNMACWPGRDSAACAERLTSGGYALVLYVASGQVIVQPPPVVPDGNVVLARYCRQLSHAARQLADELDPPSPVWPDVPSPSPRYGAAARHRLDGDPGGEVS